MYNILVCDDDKEIVNAIEIYLEKEGYKIYKANTFSYIGHNDARARWNKCSREY